jgi:intracellular septation protein A
MKHFFQALKPVVADLLSAILFVAIYEITGNVLYGVGFGIAAGVAQIGYRLLRKLPVDTMQWASIVLVVVLGALTFLTHDPRFVLIKPSIGAFAIGCVMMKRNWLGRYLPPIASENLPERVVVGFGYGWALLMFAQAAANLAAAYAFDLKTWVLVNSIMPLASWFALFVVQFLTFRYFIRRRLRAAARPQALAAAE